MEQNHQFVEYPFDLQPENIVQDKSILLNTRIFDFVLKLYMAGLILQYIFIFALVPFDDIDNRPSICYASIIFCLVMFCICACLYPLIASNIPSEYSMKFFSMSLTLQVVNLVIAGVSTFSCLKVSGMYMNEYDEGENKNIKTDVTGYIQIVTVAMFVMSMITTILLTWASIIELRAISNLMHLINPKFVKDNEKRMVTIPDTLSDHAFAQLNTKYKA